MTKKCEYCGIEYTPTKEKQKYCSGLCRQRAHRERQKDDRKKAITAYKSNAPQPRRIYNNDMSVTDPRSRLVKMRAHGLLTTQYWTLYAQVDKIYNNANGVVNGIPTDTPNFAEAVLVQIEIDGRIDCWTQRTNEK